MNKLAQLSEQLESELGSLINTIELAYDEITLTTDAKQLKALCYQLCSVEDFAFNQLIDICGVDYLLYGIDAWETNSASEHGFSRGSERKDTPLHDSEQPRFAVVYHLLSTLKNHRVRVKVYLPESRPLLPSVHDIWKAADWFEREAYDLYGILFENHPDLRRILTDYGFIGHPFRKDFPLIGKASVRYDATLEQVIYEPVDIEDRTLQPKVIRQDNRYLIKEEEKKGE